MNEYLKANQNLWNGWTELHEGSAFYDLASFRAGGSTLRPVERAELTDVVGKRLLHVQCHFGLDTLSWARQGAIVTGVDISNRSIALARQLSAETGLPATFVCNDIATLPDTLSGTFDIVYTSYGVLHWLPDLARWAAVIAHFLTPGGIFYIVEDHPFMRATSADDTGELRIDNPYFFASEPHRFEARGSYAAPGDEQTPTAHGYMWDHGIGEIVTALADAGLRIEFLHDFPFHVRQKSAGMVKRPDGLWYLTKQDGMLPMLFSLQVRKSIETI